jgi:hypothetical protein
MAFRRSAATLREKILAKGVGTMRKAFEIGGLVAAGVLIVFGIVAIVMGFNGRSTVSSNLKNEYIVGSADMTPAAIKAEALKSGIASAVKLWPSQSVAGQAIDTGSKARAFAEYMHIHALEATHGFTYAQMGIYNAKQGTPKAQLMPGGGTDNVAYALIDPKTQQPVSNGARNVWVTETALTTALNTSYMADQLALFGIVVGVALFLTGLGFGILAIGGALRNPETSFGFVKKFSHLPPKTPTVRTA